MNQEKSEENITKTIDYTDKKIKKTKKIFKIILAIIILFVVILIILFWIDVNRMRNNKPIFFSTWGYDYAPPIALKDEKIENAIKDYLVKKGDSEPKHHDNEKTFVSMRVFLIEEKAGQKLYNVYAWVLEEKYYLENSEIKQDSGFSIPYKFVVENMNGKYVVTDLKTPRDGSYYPQDIKNIFPNSVRDAIDNVHTDGTIESLQSDIQQQIKLYFHQ